MDNVKPLNKPLWKKMQRCWDNDMYVYQKPINTGMRSKVKIYLSIQGTEKWGDEVYVQNTKKLTDKIEECYHWLYDNHKTSFI